MNSYFMKPGEEDLSGIQLQNTQAAEDRSYCDDQEIPWQEKIFPVSDFEPINYYDNFALNKTPFVPIEETREIMRIIETCRKNEGSE